MHTPLAKEIDPEFRFNNMLKSLDIQPKVLAQKIAQRAVLIQLIWPVSIIASKSTKEC